MAVEMRFDEYYKVITHFCRAIPSLALSAASELAAVERDARLARSHGDLANA
jgi:hypothetical protein